MSQIDNKTSFKALKEYIANNGYQKVYLEKCGKPHTKAKKSELLDFIQEQ